MMTPIILTFVVCLMHAPTSCETRTIDTPFPTPVACLIGEPSFDPLADHPIAAYRRILSREA